MDPDQLRPYKPASKKPKTKIGASSVVAKVSVASSPKKSTSSEAPKIKKAASSPNKPASSRPVATAILSTEEVEGEPSPEPLKRKKRRTETSESTPLKMAPSDPPPSRSEDVPAPWTKVVLEKSRVPPESSWTTVPEGGSFHEVTREALKAAEELFREEAQNS